ncbi:MAG TPA: hypothetical protein VK024_07780 [Actinomycetaceae bacterium]|nr:hypothetical protein [Actinomycetaceae bacterium]
MDKHRHTPSEEPYDPTEDPDSDPEQLAGRRRPHGSQAEGEDDDSAAPSPTQPGE